MSETHADRPPAAIGLTGEIRRHAGELLRLALPVMGARAGQMVMVAVDTLFVGNFGTDDLAYLGLAAAPHSLVVTVLAGLLLGTIVLTAQAMGAGKPREAGAAWRRSLPYAVLLGVAGGLVLVVGGPLLFQAAQQPAEIAIGAGRVLPVLALGIPAAALFFTTASFLEGLKRPLPGLVFSIAANAVNALLNWVFVFGHAGLPALGAVGSAWSTTIVRWALAAAMIAYVWYLRDHDRLGVRRPAPGGLLGGWRAGTQQRRIGHAAGASFGVEAAAFHGLSLLSGLMGALALGAYTVALNLLALPFMAALGLAGATTVRVGHAHGARDRHGMALAGWTGLGMTALFLLPAVAAFALVPHPIARLFAVDPALVEAIAPVVAFSAWILIADGGQVVMGQALRGRGDVWVPTFLHTISYIVLMVPVSAALAFWAGHGLMGLFEGILIASLFSVAILSSRFAWLARRPV